MDACEYLIEMGAHNGASVETLRYSSHGLVTRPTESPANAIYTRFVADPGTLERTLFQPGRTFGPSSCDPGEATLVNVDGWLDGLFAFGVDSRDFTVRRLANARASYASSTVLFRTTMTGVSSGDAYNDVRVHLYDKLLDLDKPAQSSRYGGTTTSGASVNKADGDENLKDQVKPLNFGKTFRIEPICVNRVDHIYQVHDGAVASIAAFDGGVVMTNAGNVSSLAALAATSPSPGTFVTCLSLGLFRLGHITDDVLCCDVVEGSDQRAGALVQRILAKIGITSPALDLATVAALNAAATMVLGIYVAQERTALSIISEVLQSVQGWIVPSAAGVLQVGRFTGVGVPTWSLTEPFILTEGSSIARELSRDTENGLPVWRVVVRHSHCYRVHSRSEIAPCVLDEASNPFVSFVENEWREAIAEDASIKIKHPMAGELVIETRLTSAADAGAEAARYLALYKVRRDVLQVSVNWQDATSMLLGSTGTLTLPRLGYQAGKPMVVIGRQEVAKDDKVILTLWG